MPILRSKTISVSINCSPEKVYAFVYGVKNFPKWANGFALSAKKVGSKWILETTSGNVIFAFVKRNSLGVLDHFVTVQGKVFYNPMRVVSNETGSEVVFTLFQHDGMSSKQFTEDAQIVQCDLNSLKKVLERSSK